MSADETGVGANSWMSVTININDLINEPKEYGFLQIRYFIVPQAPSDCYIGDCYASYIVGSGESVHLSFYNPTNSEISYARASCQLIILVKVPSL